MTGIAAAQFDKRLTLQRKIISKDGLGAEISAWSDYGTVSASIKTVGREFGRFLFTAQQVREPTNLLATIRRGPPVTNLWRGIWRVVPSDSTMDQILNFVAVVPNDSRDAWLILCSQGVGQGG